MPSWHDVNALVHAPIRLAILTYLAGLGEGASADFTQLKQALATTDGNLSTHLQKLEEAKYIECQKSFVGRKPRSAYTLTAIGSTELSAYVKSLKALLKQSTLDVPR